MFSRSIRFISSSRYTLQRITKGKNTRVNIKTSTITQQQQQIVPIDPWKEVTDKESGLTYWWNQETDETTHLGAPKPTLVNQSNNNVPGPSQQLAQPQQGSMIGELGSMVAQGFAFGVGSSIARSAVNAIFDSGSSDSGSAGGDDDIVEL